MSNQETTPHYNQEHAEIAVRFMLEHKIPVPLRMLKLTRKMLEQETGEEIDDEFLFVITCKL